MEAMEGKYLELVQKCINYARSFPNLLNPILKTAHLTDLKQWTMPQRDAEINCILISRGLQDKIDGKIIGLI